MNKNMRYTLKLALVGFLLFSTLSPLRAMEEDEKDGDFKIPSPKKIREEPWITQEGKVNPDLSSKIQAFLQPVIHNILVDGRRTHETAIRSIQRKTGGQVGDFQNNLQNSIKALFEQYNQETSAFIQETADILKEPDGPLDAFIDTPEDPNSCFEIPAPKDAQGQM